MKDKSKLVAIILVIITVLVVVLSNILKKDIPEQEKEINIVTNASNFYTVNSCLYRVITYLASKNTDNMLLVLDNKYVEKNKITKENVLEIFPSIKQSSTFGATKMYYQEVNDNITKFYVKGYIEENLLVENQNISIPEREEVYFIVYLDFENKVFSIEPYDGNIFIDGDKDE